MAVLGTDVLSICQYYCPNPCWQNSTYLLWMSRVHLFHPLKQRWFLRMGKEVLPLSKQTSRKEALLAMFLLCLWKLAVTKYACFEMDKGERTLRSEGREEKTNTGSLRSQLTNSWSEFPWVTGPDSGQSPGNSVVLWVWSRVLGFPHSVHRWLLWLYTLFSVGSPVRVAVWQVPCAHPRDRGHSAAHTEAKCSP